MTEEKKFKTPEQPLSIAAKERLDKILHQIRGNKKILKREDFLTLLDLSDIEKKYVAGKLSRSNQQLIMKYLQELPEDDFQIQLSRKPSLFPREGEGPLDSNPWLSSVQESEKASSEHPSSLPLDVDALSSKLENVRQRKFSLDADPKYPLLSCIKRMLYAFGDLKTGIMDTYKELHTFVEEYMKTLLCNPKIMLSLKLLKKMFPGECRRYFELLRTKGSLTSYKAPMSTENKDSEAEDLQYFADIRSFERLAPELETPKILEIPDEEEIKDDSGIEQGADERQNFAILRSQSMTTEDYKEFVNSRGVGMLYKGKKALCKWLSVPKEVSSTRNLVEIVSLVVKLALRRMIEEAIRKRSATGSLEVIVEPLKMEELQSFANLELNLIKEIIANVEDEQNGYKMFLKDMKREAKLKKGKRVAPESDDLKTKAKKEWDKLNKKVKDEYKMRKDAERHLKTYLKTPGEKGDYIPINDYGSFVKNEIEISGTKQCDNKFLYGVFQKWLKRRKLTKK